METFLLTAMGVFGITRGLVSLINTRTLQGHIACRGLTNFDKESIEHNLADIAEHYLLGGGPSPLCSRAEVISCGPAPGSGLLPEGTALLVKQMVGEDYAALAAFGHRFSGLPFSDVDLSTLLNLTGIMANALSQILFNRQIRHLSAGLMSQSAELQDVLHQAGQARENLDRQVFHLQTLYDLTAELSPVANTEKLMETFLMMVMGTFGASRGMALLCDRKSQKVCCALRGGQSDRVWTLEEAEECLYRGFQASEDRRLAPMSVSFIADPQTAFSESEMGFAVNTAALFTVDDSLLGFTALGSPLGKSGLGAEERELLRGLTSNCMVFLKNARAFETIQALNEDLRRTNSDLRQTIADLSEARHQIRLLELAKTRLKQLIQREMERTGRLRLADILLVLLTSTVLALVFNYSSPNGIPLLHETLFQTQAPGVDPIAAHQMLSRGEALLVDARPQELFEQKHLPDAINIPAALFDILYPMKLSRMLTSGQTVLVYGRTVSKRYDEDVAQKLLQRHDNIKVIEGDMKAWEAKGLPVAP
jgi:rhodanese-related sulfurtransferase